MKVVAGEIGAEPPRFRKLRDVDSAVIGPLIELLEALQLSKPDGIALAEWDAMASERLDAVALRQAIDLYVPIGDRMRITGPGFNLLREARPLKAPSTKNIRVQMHAIERAQQRRLVSTADRREAQRAIAGSVAAGIAAGRRSRSKPTWLRLYHENSPALRALFVPQNRWFVWSEAQTEAWVVAKETDGSWTVLTSLKVHSPVR